ncbi:MAG TPA: response regulator transcription factor [Candidatus Sulfotelmatobacter sp.]|nr:response regulator transcription factor [Candidatus Sulfotelmatobacter sp.]
MKTTENVLLKEAPGVSAPARASISSSERRILRVWVVDDNAPLRELFAQLLTKQPGLRCTRQFGSAEALLATLAEERPPDLILLDINLSGQSGLAAIRPIKKLAPAVKVLVMTMFSNSYYEVEAFRAGASGFLLKSYEFAEIVKLIHAAYRTPGVPDLFPYVSRHKESALKLNLEKAGAGGAGKGLSLVGAWRRLVGGPGRQTAS